MSDYPLEQTQTSAVVHVDFGGGWRYGFPRVLDRDNNMSMVDWLISKGVPRWLAEQSENQLRIWAVPTGASQQNFPPTNEDLTID